MTYVLNNADVLPVPVLAETTRTVEKPSLLRRVYDVIVESRMRSAARALRAHNILVNETGIVLGDVSYTSLSSDRSLPFNR